MRIFTKQECICNVIASLHTHTQQKQTEQRERKSDIQTERRCCLIESIERLQCHSTFTQKLIHPTTPKHVVLAQAAFLSHSHSHSHSQSRSQSHSRSQELQGCVVIDLSVAVTFVTCYEEEEKHRPKIAKKELWPSQKSQAAAMHAGGVTGKIRRHTTTTRKALPKRLEKSGKIPPSCGSCICNQRRILTKLVR